MAGGTGVGTVSRVALAAVAVMAFAAAGLGGAVGVGEPLYPDLRTLPPVGLDLPTEQQNGKYVLRFSNTVWNAGAGRLEIEGPIDPEAPDKTLFQNAYDAPVGGEQAARRPVDSDVLYHPDHQHYHFADFAAYRLYQQAKDGTYRATSKRGVKTGFCIMDTAPVGDSPAPSGPYSACSQELQGLSVGWGDEYRRYLPDQWVVLGRRPLKDGEYALRSTADPAGKIAEEDEGNNTAVVYFTVKDGRLGPERSRP
jgi:hypothetical protein